MGLFLELSIKVMFTIADLDAIAEDQFLPEENEEGNEGEAEEEEVPPSQPIRVSITITKASICDRTSLRMF